MKIQDFFKESFYINLDSRTDRKELFEEEMKTIKRFSNELMKE